jgi:predicted nucleic acid-binding protein
VKVVADATPLIVLAKIGLLDLLPKLHPLVHISTEVYDEVVVAGHGLPGASQVAQAKWIEVKPMQRSSDLSEAQSRFGLGLGELSTILLAKEIGARMVLIDETRGRRLAKEEGLDVLGTVGILESLFKRRELDDLRAAFEKLLFHQVHLDRDLLNRRLHLFGLTPL